MSRKRKEYIEALSPHYVEKSVPEIESEVGHNVTQMSASINPHGPSPLALKAIFDHVGELHQYPNSTAEPLKEAIAEHEGVSASRVLVGNGTSAILRSVLEVTTDPKDEVVYSVPSSLLFQRLSQSKGLVERQVGLDANYRHDAESLLEAVGDKTRVVYLTNPNHPMGTAVELTWIEQFLAHIPSDVYVVINESSIEYATAEGVQSAKSLLDRYDNLVVIRTFSIAYGLAGLRCSYAYGPEELVRQVEKLLLPYSVNFLAQVGCAAALKDDDYIRRTAEENNANRKLMESGLKKLDRYQVTWVEASQANFITLFVPILGDQFAETLLKEGFHVRSLTRYGLDNAVRVSLGTRPDTIRSVYAMARVLRDLLGG